MHATSNRKALTRNSADWLDALDLDDAPPVVLTVSVPDMWAPSARWLSPSAEDRARVRAAVEAQDRARDMEEREWAVLRLDAVQRDVPVVDDCVGAVRQTWLDWCGAALCVAPLVGVAVWVLRVMM